MSDSADGGAIVVDASVLVDALVAADGAAVRVQLRERQLHVPDIVDYEVMSALRGLVLGGRLSEERASDAWGDFLDLDLRRASLRPMGSGVWSLRHRLTTYDAAYAILADLLGLPFWTRDLRLAAAAEDLPVPHFSAEAGVDAFAIPIPPR